MTPTIATVEDWDLGSLSQTATELRAGSGKLAMNATTVLNELDRVSADWDAEGFNAASVVAKDRAGQLTERSERWNAAAQVLVTAAEQIGLLRQEITATVSDPILKSLFAFADDGGVSVSAEHLARIAAAYRGDHEQHTAAVLAAERSAAQLQDKLRTLLATADVGTQHYDWLVENALLGHTENDRPFVPRVPPPPPRPTAPIEDANLDGSGPENYDSVDPSMREEIYLQGLRAAAKGGAFATGGNLELASGMLNHYFGNSGRDYNISVTDMIKDMDNYKTASRQEATDSYLNATTLMPEGYTGPVAFQGAWNGGTEGFRPDPRENPDYWAALGTISYQTSGVALPAEDGHVEIQYQSSVYDYYNWDTTDNSPSEQYSDLNDLHRAGWARNFNVVGTSDTFAFGYTQ